MAEKVRLGLIGLGSIGKVHLRSCLRLKSAKLVAVSDVSPKCQKFAKDMGVKKVFSDYQELLKNDLVDAIIISLPTHLHLSCAQKATEAGKDIFMEKPLARNVAEGEQVISAARKSGAKLMVGYPSRFLSSFQSLKHQMRSGMLGEVQIAYATNIGSGPFFHRVEESLPQPVPSWWFSKELTGGGALIDMGCHMINLVRWYFGEVKDIDSYLGYRFNMDFEDHAICLLRFTDGQTAIVNVGWFSKESQIRVDVYGTVKHASVEHTPPNRIISIIQLLTKRTPQFYEAHLKELQYFVHCIKHDVPPSPSGDDAVKDLQIISLAYRGGTELRHGNLLSRFTQSTRTGFS